MSVLTLVTAGLALIVVGLLIALWSARTQLRESREQEAVGRRIAEKYMSERDAYWRELERARTIIDAVRHIEPKISRVGHVVAGASNYRLLRALKALMQRYDAGS